MKKILLRTSAKNNSTTKSYLDAVARGKKNQHVVPSEKGWAVKSSGSLRAKKFSTQREAISAGREIAKNQKTELFIHGRDGRIRERNSYGNDPFPPR